jgi:SnoaL-like domain
MNDDTLEIRLRRIEDERAIERLIACYGPLVDAGEADAAARLWATDGSYDVEGWHMKSRADVADMVRSDAHQGLIGRGSSHFLGPANHFQLRRIDDRWQIVARTTRALDGRTEARELLSDGLAGRAR